MQMVKSTPNAHQETISSVYTLVVYKWYFCISWNIPFLAKSI